MRMLFESLIAHKQGYGDKTEDWEQVFYSGGRQGLFTIYIKNPSGFKLCKWNATISIRKSRSEHALSISRTIGKNRKYIVKGLELDGKPSKM